MFALTRMFAVTALLTTLLVPAAQAAGIAYGALVDQLRIENKTKAELKETWKKYKGQEVTWSGTVTEAKTGKKNAKVYVLDSSRKNYKGANIQINSRDLERAAKLKRGQAIRFKGQLHNFKNHNNGAVTISIRHAEFL
jgi:putative lipoic acid-binding regulatory protein